MAYSNKHTKEEIIAKLVSEIKKKLPAPQAKLIVEFTKQLYGTISLEDLQDRDIIDWYGAILSYWHFIAQRKPEEYKVRVYNPHFEHNGWQSTHTVIEVIQQDMPFLVDSIRMAVNRFDLTIHLVVHMGGLKVVRDEDNHISNVFPFQYKGKDCISEAPIYLEVDRQTDPKILEELKNEIEKALKDVHVAVHDWQEMLRRVDETYKRLEKYPPAGEHYEVQEAIDFLKWIRNHHFTFLGCRDYEIVGKDNERALRIVENSNFGVLSDTTHSKVYRSFVEMPDAARQLLLSSQLLIIYKTNTKSTIHRPTYTDGIDVKLFNEAGELVGVRRFIGLYTSTAYNSSPKEIPFLRLKVAKVLEKSRLAPSGHSGKALLNILETLPRDELFQANAEELSELAQGILNLQERQRIRLFVRKDIYNRFISCLVYVPKDRFNTELRRSMQEILQRAFKGTESTFSTLFTESVLARIHFVIRINPKEPLVYDVSELEARLIEISRSWRDDLKNNLLDYYGEERGNALAQRYSRAFSASYRENFSPRTALFDIEHIEELGASNSLSMLLYTPLDDLSGLIRFKLFCPGHTIPLSDILPMLENMGLRVINEQPHQIVTRERKTFWINDFGMIHKQGLELDVDEVKDIFQETFRKVWFDEAENDGFNGLVLTARLNWQEITALRAYAKYLKQTGFTFSQNYIEEALSNNPHIARGLVNLFKYKFEPSSEAKTDKEIKVLENKILEQLEQVVNLDEDRILRRFLDVINATLRTNYYQKTAVGKVKEYLSFKLYPKAISDLPLPVPMFEIYVYSPRFEGVHLRSAKVARGGLRWSDRREDFRTEILGLMKAQQVKNAVIVPAGAKGGFVPNRLPLDSTREKLMEEVIACYKNFIRGMLDITDNFVGEQVVPPQDTVCYDEDDYYLVVAADKGTATFSDIANEISAEYKFWLGDAFASGGATGYDHKKMGITARGAWESVKRHFRELGVDTQTQNFTVIGIGDMAGDVFGNGMLLSRHIKLVGAFNHMHIFLDPSPDPEGSFKERERLFKLPRSSWENYDNKLLSKGGGIFRRSAKSIQLTPEIKALLDVSQDFLTPNEVIKAMLKAPIDLIWNGGIGTFIKASSETHSDAGDRSNDATRVNGKDLRCKVIGEGGNLGLTQLGRVEYALNGGKINTDFIDNSGGVDCSDSEVNIKILLNGIVASGDMTIKQRNEMLAKMTDEVADLVLQNNYYQTLAISLAEFHAAMNANLFIRYIEVLVQTGNLDPVLEFLPTAPELFERKNNKQGLTRPEIAVLLAYTKAMIKSEILASDVPEDSYLSRTIEREFPKLLCKKFSKQMSEHQLRREIIATQLSNSMVNEMGCTFATRLFDETGASITSIVKGYSIVKNIYNIPGIMQQIFELDNKVSTDIQAIISLDLIRLVRRATRWFLRNRRHLEVNAEVDYFAAEVEELKKNVQPLLGGRQKEIFEEGLQTYLEAGIPEKIAEEIVTVRTLFSALDIIEAAKENSFSVLDVATSYYLVGARLELGWFREQIMQSSVDSHWGSLARATIRDDLDRQQRNLAICVLTDLDPQLSLSENVEHWMKQHEISVNRWHKMLVDLRASSNINFTMFSVALRELMDLAQIATMLRKTV